MSRAKRNKSTLLFYILLAYTLLQITWWIYQVIIFSKQLDPSGTLSKRTVRMLSAEFAVFFLVICGAIYWINQVFKSEMTLLERQNNFSLSVTHELKTPIASSSLMIDTLIERKEDLSADQQENLLKKIKSDQKRLNELIDKILLSSRLSGNNIVLKKEEINLTKFAQSIIERYNEQGLVVLETPDDYILQADRFYLTSVFNNLIENAFKYGKEKKVTIRILKSNTHVEVHFQNEGLAIDKTALKRIYDPYYREEKAENKSTQGTGLGLYIVKRIIAKHNGVITYKRTENKVHNFIIKLPIN